MGWLHKHCNGSNLIGHNTAALPLFLVISETVGFCFSAYICSQEVVCHLNYFSTAPFGIIKELMCSERKGQIQGTNPFIHELILLGKKKTKE